MLYLIKFLYLWLLPPAGIILLLMGLELYLIFRRSPGRKFLGIVIILFYLLSIRLGSGLLAKPLENYYQQPDIGELHGDVLILLGSGSLAGVKDFNGLGQPSESFAKNILFAARLQRVMDLPMIISGGTVFQDTGSEADIAVRNLEALGISKNRMIIENRSRNTAENVLFCGEICQKHGWHHPILIAAAMHSPRANLLFEKSGLKCQPYPAHRRTAGIWNFNPILDLVPRSECLDISAGALKEYMGIVASIILKR